MNKTDYGTKLNKHISLNSNQEIKEICDQFFKNRKIKITHLNYIRKKNDGTIYYLCSNHDWLVHYYNNLYPSIGAFEQNDNMLKQKYVLWDSIDDGDIILQDSKNILGVAHGITIIEKLDNGNAFYNFGNTEKKPTEVNNYISHLDILNEFIYFFNEKAKFIINEAEKKRLILPRQSHDELIIHSNDPLDSKPTNLSKSLFVDDNYNVSISSRELECVEWYLKGKTAIEIALILCLSKRTIETHIENVKEKLQCRNLAQLGYLIAMIKYRNFGFIPHPYK